MKHNERVEFVNALSAELEEERDVCGETENEYAVEEAIN